MGNMFSQEEMTTEKKGELFHLVADPREEHNIAGLDRERARRLRELIEARVIRPF